MRIAVSTQVTIVLGLGAIAGALVLFGCQPKSTANGWQVNGTPTHHDPHQPWWSYQLVYHPDSGVYFEPYSQTYHWQESGEWRSSKRRPGPVAWRAEDAVVVKLNWDTPEFGHDSIVAVHPNRSTWNRSHAISVAPEFQNDMALTQAAANAKADAESLCTCDDHDDTYTIRMPNSSNYPSPASKNAQASKSNASPSASESSPSESSSETPSEPTAVAGATGSDNPE